MAFEAIMDATANLKVEDMVHDCRPLLVVHKDGRVERFLGTDLVPPSFDCATGVESKDVGMDEEAGTYVRLYKPQNVDRVGVLVYYHGGGFCVESASSPLFHSYLNNLSSKAKVIVVSVEYRRAPEHPLPIAYEDSWAALRWLFTTRDEAWINDHADLSRVFLAGDSAGANIAHNVARRFGRNDESIYQIGSIKGIVLVHPYFWGSERIGSEQEKVTLFGFNSLMDKVWKMAYPGSSGLDDPKINPEMDPGLSELATDRVMVCVAEQDVLRDRGFYYKEVLLKSGWQGNVSVVETLGEVHVFHLFKSASPKAEDLMNHIVAFLNAP